jgi:hypothetical protein
LDNELLSRASTRGEGQLHAGAAGLSFPPASDRRSCEANRVRTVDGPRDLIGTHVGGATVAAGFRINS